VLLDLAHTRRVLLFGGKGGVGKTTVAAATALAAAREGRRVLLVSTDPAHNLGHLWDRPIGPQAVRVAAGLDALELDPGTIVARHLAEVGETLRRLMPAHLAGEVDRHMALSRDAPGMQEAALLEQIAELIEGESGRYDLVVLDTAPSGHTARLMALPEIMAAWTEGLLARQKRVERFGTALGNLGVATGSHDVASKVFGGGPDEGSRDDRIRHLLHRRRHRFERLRAALADAERTAFVIVLVAERLPVLETLELHAQLVAAGVSVGGLVVNKRTPAHAGGFLADRHAQEAVHLATLAAGLPGLTAQELPLLARDVTGAAALEDFADLVVAAR
jgi:arsenite-transporting ATPase